MFTFIKNLIEGIAILVVLCVLILGNMFFGPLWEEE